jgi:hypothetical protein
MHSLGRAIAEVAVSPPRRFRATSRTARTIILDAATQTLPGLLQLVLESALVGTELHTLDFSKGHLLTFPFIDNLCIFLT